MSQEITVTASMSVSKASLKYSLPSASQLIDLSGSRYSGGVQDIGTSVEQIVLGSDLATAGWAVFTNLDTANYVQIGASNGTPYLLRLNAGETVVLRLTTTTLYALANTATVKLQFIVFEA